MKHMYISNFAATDAFNKATQAELNNYFTKMKENGKTHGFDVVFWGNPWGVIESGNFTVISDKSLDKYIEWRGIWGQQAAKEKLPTYWIAGNTLMVTSF